MAQTFSITAINLLVLLLLISMVKGKGFQPCPEISRDFRFPCTCALGPNEAGLDGNPSISVNCDGVVFPGDDVPPLPYGAPIVSFSQKWAGHQALPTHIFSTSGLPLRKIDLSGNSLRRLTERLLMGLQATLVELKLADNLLGDTLNPIFSTNEFHGLSHLQLLDLSGNVIKALEEGIFEGCFNLQELYLDRNSFTYIPNSSLNGPKSLKILSLKYNRIETIKTSALLTQLNLEKIDLSSNLIGIIEGGAFSGLNRLKSLILSRNKLTRFNSDVFQGANNLQQLDLSENFISEFPTIALKTFVNLQYLNLSSNLIQNLDNSQLDILTNLFHLDLSRNSINNIVPGTFLGLKQLRKLDISVNSLRTIEDDAFEGLDSLEHLNLQDNNILLIPASALGRLPLLTSLQLDYNRIAALSGNILQSIAERVTKLVVARNVVRELPAASFEQFQNLQHLDLTRNLLTQLNSDAFSGLETTLLKLDLGQNRISTIVGSNLGLVKLEELDLSRNQFSELPRNVFASLSALRSLNLSHNPFTGFSWKLLQKQENLEVFDLSYTKLKQLSSDLFRKTTALTNVYLKRNFLSEIPERAFANLTNLSLVDLSYNNINNIKSGAFVNVMNIKKLNLKGNQLTSFKGEFFNTGTSLETLDISRNHLSYLFPSSFRIHPRLKRIYAAENKFNFFPAELIGTLQFLEYIDLSGNALKTVEELDFARLPRLNTLILANNQLEAISEMSFHNSTQLQVLDLSHNKLERFGERTFEGLVRLKLLNLENNSLSDLPETIFDRSKLQMLEHVNLARNAFVVAPLKALERQYFFLASVDLSFNQIKDIQSDNSIMVNIKDLDLSFNPLSEETVRNILEEPKTVRRLNLAGTGIERISVLETPFLHYLNVSFNNITSLDERIFERTTLLENLDVSHNQLSDISDFPRIWILLKNLQSLNLSMNSIKTIAQNDFNGLKSLRYLNLQSLNSCEKIEKNAFKSTPNLVSLKAFNYPKLGYIDLQGLLQNIPFVQQVIIETKDAAVGSDQLQAVLHPQLVELGLVGRRLKSVSSGTLSGIKGSHVLIHLTNTSLTSLPPALFFPVPRSSSISLDVEGSHLTTLSQQMLATLDDRRGDLRIRGLDSNPIICDCNARALRRWITSHMTTIKCAGPAQVAGRLLAEIGDDELSCDRKTTSGIPSTTVWRTTKKPFYKTTEPEIIWSLPVSESPKKKVATTLNNDDILIIGIVGGVVAFIIILIIIICIIRLKMTGNQQNGPVLGPMMGANGSNCACSVKGGMSVYAVPPAYSYSATLPHKIQTGVRGTNYSTMGRVPYYQNSGQPYVVAFPAPDEKVYR